MIIGTPIPPWPLRVVSPTDVVVGTNRLNFADGAAAGCLPESRPRTTAICEEKNKMIPLIQNINTCIH